MDNHTSPSKDGDKKQWVQFADDEDAKGEQTNTNSDAKDICISIKKPPPNRKDVSDYNGQQSLESENNSTAAVVDAVIEIVSSSSASGVNGHNARAQNNASERISPIEVHTNSKTRKPNFADVEANGNGMITSENPDRLGNTAVAGRNTSGFTNGDVIVSVLPVNTKWPWITPATFRPELVPEDLMVPGLTVTVEEYVHAMDLMTSDFRFNIYTICYRRLLASWLFIAFFILIVILFSGVVGIHLFTLGISWLIVNAAAVFFCLYIKIKINKGVEECMARVNNLFIKHNLVIGLDDRGRISCHKVHLCFIYFDPKACIQRLEATMQNEIEQAAIPEPEMPARSEHPRTRVIPPKQNGERLFLKYIQRWSKDFLRRRLDWTIGEGTENPCSPRHLTSALCPCQYIEEYTRHKPKKESSGNFPWFSWPSKFF